VIHTTIRASQGDRPLPHGMGADDLDLTRLYSPPITVIARDPDVRGDIAVQLLPDTIRQRGGRAVLLPTTPIVRESSAPRHDALTG